MLYDPKWDKDKQLGPISLKAFIAWLETMPADGYYDYGDAGVCALAQFRGHLGFCGQDCIIDLDITLVPDWRDILKDIVAHDFDENSWTFGAALERARQCLAAS